MSTLENQPPRRIAAVMAIVFLGVVGLGMAGAFG